MPQCESTGMGTGKLRDGPMAAAAETASILSIYRPEVSPATLSFTISSRGSL